MDNSVQIETSYFDAKAWKFVYKEQKLVALSNIFSFFVNFQASFIDVDCWLIIYSCLSVTVFF